MSSFKPQPGRPMTLRGKVWAKLVSAVSAQEDFMPWMVIGRVDGGDHIDVMVPEGVSNGWTDAQKQWFKSEMHRLANVIVGEEVCNGLQEEEGE